MNSTLKNRRHFLQQSSCLLAAGMVIATSGCGAKKLSGCVSPEEQSSGLRASLGYSSQAADVDKSCQDCAFFTPEQDPEACGQCELLQGSVEASGTCNSWSAGA